MQANPATLLAAVLAVALLVAAWVAIGRAQPAAGSPAAGMDNRQLDKLIKEQFPAESIGGSLGFWRVELAEEAAVEPEANGKPIEEPDAGEGDEVGPGGGDRLPPVLLVVTDERANRMRIMMPIRPFDPQQEEDLRLALIALHANYDRALDARYAIHDGVLWSAFIHPLGSLTPADFENALQQVRTLRDNTGTTYSSSELLFGPGQQQDAPDEGDEPADGDDEEKGGVV